jgi:hypothetical protein
MYLNSPEQKSGPEARYPEANTGFALSPVFLSGANYSILILAMRKRKPESFSATKAVKSNARERVGQPKPARVIEDEPRRGRKMKHKPKLDDLIRREE